MIPPMSRRRSWLTTSSAASRLVFVIVSSSAAPLPRPMKTAGVDVDHGQRLGVVDHQVAAAGQIDAPREHALDRLVDAVGLEQRLLLLPQLDALDQLGGGAREERDQALVLLLVVDDRALEVRGEDVAHDAHRQVGLLEDEIRGDRVLDAFAEHLVQLVQVLQLALEVLALGAVRGGAHDHPAARRGPGPRSACAGVRARGPPGGARRRRPRPWGRRPCSARRSSAPSTAARPSSSAGP